MAPRQLIQTWVASGVLMNMIGMGMVLSFPTCLLPSLMSPESDIHTDMDTASWLASAFGVACGPGCVVSWLLMDWYGRRLSHLLALIPSVLGWALIFLAPNIPSLMIGRLCGGFSAGCTVNLGAIVIGEYTSPQLRGIFLILKSATLCIGSLILHTMAYFLHWRTVAAFGFVIHLTSIVIVYSWPESPAWLAYKKQFEASASSFFYLRGNDEESKRELEDLFKAQEKNVQIRQYDMNYWKGFGKRILRKDFRKPFLIALCASVLLESSGRHFFPAYAMQIIEKVTGWNSLYVVIGIDALGAIGAASAALLARTVRRRMLLLSSASFALLVLMTFCLYNFLSTYQLISQRPFIPIILLLIYFILTNIGCSPIPIALTGEIFPLAHRGIAPALLGTVMSLYMMLLLKIVPFLMATVKLHGMFAIFGVAMGGSLVILYFILPETKDRTLQEIDDYFNYGYFLDKGVRMEEMRMIKESET